MTKLERRDADKSDEPFIPIADFDELLLGLANLAEHGDNEAKDNAERK